MDSLILARALHILGVVVWIGGLSMATTVAIPAVRRGDLGPDKLRAFEAIERRFIWQARTAVLIVGLTGIYMTHQFNLWDRFLSLQYWWMHAMAGVWLLFMAVLFVAEPLVLHRHFHKLAHTSPELAFRWLQRAHVILYVLTFITVFGAAVGSHGGF